jgi:hypothetical protein
MTNQQLTIEDMNAFHRSVATKMDDMRTRMKQKEEISNRQIEELQQELNILNSNLLTTENGKFVVCSHLGPLLRRIKLSNPFP